MSRIDFLPIEEAERLAGKRLDRRRKYFIWEGRICYDGHCTVSCSGCFESGEYMGLAPNYLYDEKDSCHIGTGCDECGFTGKRRMHFPIPHDIPLEPD